MGSHQNQLFIGRIDELEMLQAQLSTVLSGNGKLVLISGEAGIGKSRLVAEFFEIAGRTDIFTFTTRCKKGLMYPLQPFRDLYESMCTDEATPMPARGDAKRILEEYLRPKSVGTNVPTENIDILRMQMSILSNLESIQKNKPILLFIDDLHWADATSVNLLNYINRNLKKLRIMVIGAYRSEELKDESGEKTPFLDGLKLMQRERNVIDLTLNRFDYEEMRELAERTLKGKIDLSMLSKIGGQSNGVPLHVLELLNYLQHSGGLRENKGSWSFIGRDLPIPETIGSVIQKRIEDLTEEERLVLQTLSLLKVNVNVNFLQSVCKMPNYKLMESLDVLKTKYDFVTGLDDRYSIKHDLISKATNQGMPSEISVRLNQAIAEKMLLDPMFFDRFDLLSEHYYNGKDKERCIEYSQLAGKKSLDFQDYLSGLQYFERIVELAKLDPNDLPSRLVAWEGMGDCYRELGAFLKARQNYVSALKTTNDRNQRARILRKIAESSFPFEREDTFWTSRMDYIDEALQLNQDDDLERAEILSTKAVFLVWEGSDDEAEKSYLKAEELFRKFNSPGRYALTLLTHAHHLLTVGDYKAAAEKFREANDMLEKGVDQKARMELAISMCELHFILGSYEDAFVDIKNTIDLALKFGDYRAVSYLYFYRSMINIDEDDLEKAFEDASLGRDYMSVLTDDAFGSIVPGTAMSLILVLLGRNEEAQILINKGLEICSQLPPNVDTFFPGLMVMISGLMSCNLGRSEQGIETIERGIALLERKRMGKYFQALGYEWIGAIHDERNETDLAHENYLSAFRIMHQIGNVRHESKIADVMKQ